MELGGFAENPKVIDGDFNAFNYCTAENYVDAFYAENFDAIGEIDDIHFENICYWYNYNADLNNEKVVDQIRNGTFKTFKNRTIVDAIYENKNVCLAEIYIKNWVYSPKLILISLLYGDNKIMLFDPNGSEENYNKIFKDLFDFIDFELENIEDKNEFLKKIKYNMSRICYTKDFNPKHSLEIAKNYNFVKQIRKDKSI